MRMLFTSTPGFGSLHPLIAMACAARDAGHEAAIATGEERRTTVERLGVTFFPAGDDIRAAFRERYPDVAIPPIDAAGSLRVRALGFGGVFVELMLPGLFAACAAWRPDIIIRTHLAYAGWLVAEELGIPHATIEEAASGIEASNREVMSGPLNAQLAKRGLPPDPELASLYRYLVLVPFPPSLRHPDAPFGPTARRIRPLIFSDSHDDTAPAWMNALPRGPCVHASLGTVANRPEILRAIVDGLAGEPLTLVLATGPFVTPESLGALPANVFAAQYVPHSQLLPLCDAIITHAGAGTLIAAVNAGLPMVLVPLFGDQPPNAECAAAAGVGVIIEPSSLTPEAMREAVRSVLRDERYRQSVAALRDEIDALPGHETGVQWLEAVASRRAPLSAES